MLPSSVQKEDTASEEERGIWRKSDLNNFHSSHSCQLSPCPQNDYIAASRLTTCFVSNSYISSEGRQSRIKNVNMTGFTPGNPNHCRACM